MAPIIIVVAIINLLANINNYNIPDDPELRNIRVRRDDVASIRKREVDMKSLLQGDHYERRAKRAYYNSNYNYNVSPTTTLYNQVTSNYNYQYIGTTYSPTHRWQYNPFNIPPNGQQQPAYNQQQSVYTQQQPVYTRQQPSYTQQLPSYTQQQPSYTQQQPSYTQQQPVMDNNGGYKIANANSLPFSNGTVSNESIETTTPRIACILCNVGCPAFMKKMFEFCVPDTEDAEENDYL